MARFSDFWLRPGEQLDVYKRQIQAAAAKMNMSYSKGWKMINKVEKELGFRFLNRCNGGKNGGSSTITPEGRLFMERYHAMLEDVYKRQPQMWWDNAKLALKKIMAESGAKGEDILAIGISYQMHGLVCVDKNQQVLRPSIILSLIHIWSVLDFIILVMPVSFRL